MSVSLLWSLTGTLTPTTLRDGAGGAVPTSRAKIFWLKMSFSLASGFSFPREKGGVGKE